MMKTDDGKTFGAFISRIKLLHFNKCKLLCMCSGNTIIRNVQSSGT